MNKWTPVYESYPEEEDSYLVCFDDGFVATAEYGVDGFELWADSGEVVAWQPKPEPYKEKTFDELIYEGNDVEALRYFSREYYNSGRMGYTRKSLIDRCADKLEQMEKENDNG